MKALIKQYLPYIAAIAIFFVISIGYFSPALLEGKKLNQGDIRNGAGMARDAGTLQQETGEKSLWSGRMFSGMPTYQISPFYSTSPVMKTLRSAFQGFLPDPASYLFAYMFGFFILLVALGVSPWLAIIGAIAYAFSSYFLIIIEAGHIWKVWVLGLVPPTLAGIIWAYRGKLLTGGILIALFTALQLFSNHPQMTYYFLLLTGCIVIGRFYVDFKNKQLPQFIKATAVILLAGIIGVGANATNLILSAKYSEQTIRGKSELTANAENQSGGLDRDYATQWSYGIGETATLLIPDTKGGASGYMGMNHKAAVDGCSPDPNIKQFVAQQNSYWGDQPFTSGPVYAGAFILFLFIFGLFVVDGYLKWALLAASLFSIMLSWGHNFMGLTNLFFDYFPMYNKFRAVSSILVVAELCIPLLALLALWKVVQHPPLLKSKQKEFFISLGLTAGIAFLFILAPSVFFNFTSDAEAAQFAPYYKNAQYAAAFDALEVARISAFRADAWRSIIIIAIGAGLLWLYGRNTVNQKLLIAGLAVLVLVDLGGVDKRYLNNSSFFPPAQTKAAFEPTPADNLILQDTDPDYRVLNLTVSPFQDAGTSYFHKSIGGYHAAKLRRYQDLIDRYLSKMNRPTLNMLNTRYFIIPGQNGAPMVDQNPDALGNAWFVDSLHIVNNADEELAALENFNPRTTAVVDKRFASRLEGFVPRHDDSAGIRLTNYKINDISYRSGAGSEQLAVFSEIYYDDGLTRWDAYIDGQPVKPIRVNYVLRALRIPAGEHDIQFVFKPKAYTMLEAISTTCMWLILLSIVAALSLAVRKKTKPHEKEGCYTK